MIGYLAAKVHSKLKEINEKMAPPKSSPQPSSTMSQPPHRPPECLKRAGRRVPIAVLQSTRERQFVRALVAVRRVFGVDDGSPEDRYQVASGSSAMVAGWGPLEPTDHPRGTRHHRYARQQMRPKPPPFRPQIWPVVEISDWFQATSRFPTIPATSRDIKQSNTRRTRVS